jgi:hypothetical protein
MWQRILENIFGQKKTPESDKRAAYTTWQRQQNAENSLALSRVISGNDPEVTRIVELSIQDPAGYYRSTGKDARLFESEADVDPFYVAYDSLQRKGHIGYIDWRSDADELMAALNPLLEKRQLHEFNWSFIDELCNAENWEALKNENLLEIVGGKIADEGFVFVSINTGGDNYVFAILAPDEFAKIDGLKGRDYSIGRFG